MTKSKLNKITKVKDDDYGSLKSMLNLIPPVFYFDDEYKNIIQNKYFDLNPTNKKAS